MRDLESPEALGAELVTRATCSGPTTAPRSGSSASSRAGRSSSPRACSSSTPPSPSASRATRARLRPDRARPRARAAHGHRARPQPPARVEDRLHRLLWHLADRRGHVRADGIVLRLPVTQEQLGRLVGARRPTVSLALRSLRERGLVRRGDADEWVLANQPPVPES
jgi:hypothetical protein